MVYNLLLIINQATYFNKYVIPSTGSTCLINVIKNGDLVFFSCRYQQKCDELEVQEKDLYSKINNVEKEKKDIVLYLKRTLAQKEGELMDLAETLSRHQQAQEAERESFELQLSLLRHQLQETKETFTSENMALGTPESHIHIEYKHIIK